MRDPKTTRSLSTFCPMLGWYAIELILWVGGANRTAKALTNNLSSSIRTWYFILSNREKSPIPSVSLHNFSNFFLQKSFNGFFTEPRWKQWLLTSLSPTSFHLSTLSITVDLFHFLNDFLLLQSLFSHSGPGLHLWPALRIVTGEMKAKRNLIFL